MTLLSKVFIVAFNSVAIDGYLSAISAWENALRQRILAKLPYHDAIARGAGGKFEEFVSELAGGQ